MTMTTPHDRRTHTDPSRGQGSRGAGGRGGGVWGCGSPAREGSTDREGGREEHQEGEAVAGWVVRKRPRFRVPHLAAESAESGRFLPAGRRRTRNRDMVRFPARPFRTSPEGANPRTPRRPA